MCVNVRVINCTMFYCDLRGRIKGNAQSLYHVMNVGHVSVQYRADIARACVQ